MRPNMPRRGSLDHQTLGGQRGRAHCARRGRDSANASHEHLLGGQPRSLGEHVGVDRLLQHGLQLHPQRCPGAAVDATAAHESIRNLRAASLSADSKSRTTTTTTPGRAPASGSPCRYPLPGSGRAARRPVSCRERRPPASPSRSRAVSSGTALVLHQVAQAAAACARDAPARSSRGCPSCAGSSARWKMMTIRDVGPGAESDAPPRSAGRAGTRSSCTNRVRHPSTSAQARPDREAHGDSIDDSHPGRRSGCLWSR